MWNRFSFVLVVPTVEAIHIIASHFKYDFLYSCAVIDIVLRGVARSLGDSSASLVDCAAGVVFKSASKESAWNEDRCQCTSCSQLFTHRRRRYRCAARPLSLHVYHILTDVHITQGYAVCCERPLMLFMRGLGRQSRHNFSKEITGSHWCQSLFGTYPKRGQLNS